MRFFHFYIRNPGGATPIARKYPFGSSPTGQGDTQTSYREVRNYSLSPCMRLTTVLEMESGHHEITKSASHFAVECMQDLWTKVLRCKPIYDKNGSNREAHWKNETVGQSIWKIVQIYWAKTKLALLQKFARHVLFLVYSELAYGTIELGQSSKLKRKSGGSFHTHTIFECHVWFNLWEPWWLS